jgi:hypothetical protein
MFLIQEQWNTERKGIGQSPFDEAQTDLKNAQIATVMTIDQMTEPIANGATADRDEPDIE